MEDIQEEMEIREMLTDLIIKIEFSKDKNENIDYAIRLLNELKDESNKSK